MASIVLHGLWWALARSPSELPPLAATATPPIQLNWSTEVIRPTPKAAPHLVSQSKRSATGRPTSPRPTEVVAHSGGTVAVAAGGAVEPDDESADGTVARFFDSGELTVQPKPRHASTRQTVLQAGRRWHVLLTVSARGRVEGVVPLEVGPTIPIHIRQYLAAVRFAPAEFRGEVVSTSVAAWLTVAEGSDGGSEPWQLDCANWTLGEGP